MLHLLKLFLSTHPVEATLPYHAGINIYLCGIYIVHINQNQHTPHIYIYIYMGTHIIYIYMGTHIIYIYIYMRIYIYISALSLDSPCLNATAAKVVKSPRIKARTALQCGVLNGWQPQNTKRFCRLSKKDLFNYVIS